MKYATYTIVCLTLSLFMVTRCPAEDDLSRIKIIIQKVDNISFYSFESKTFSGSGEPATSKVWVKGKLRRGETRSPILKNPTITIWRGSDFYRYNDHQKKFVKEDFGFNTNDIGETVIDLANKEGYSLKIVGHEKIGSYPCIVVELVSDEGNGTFHKKQWIWEDKGLMVREEIEAMLGPNKIHTTTENSNFKFETLPDSLFATNP